MSGSVQSAGHVRQAQNLSDENVDETGLVVDMRVLASAHRVVTGGAGSC
jgi:hypothetical protein